jgi:hypothetical protein
LWKWDRTCILIFAAKHKKGDEAMVHEHTGKYPYGKDNIIKRMRKIDKQAKGSIKMIEENLLP